MATSSAIFSASRVELGAGLDGVTAGAAVTGDDGEAVSDGREVAVSGTAGVMGDPVVAVVDWSLGGRVPVPAGRMSSFCPGLMITVSAPRLLSCRMSSIVTPYETAMLQSVSPLPTT